MSLSQHWAITISLILFVVAFAATAFLMWFWRDSHKVLMPSLVTLGVFSSLMVIAGCSLGWSLDDNNFYHVDSGTVIDNEHDPELHGAEGAYLPEAWKIEIKDRTGRTRWIDVSHDDYLKYAKWTQYPRP